MKISFYYCGNCGNEIKNIFIKYMTKIGFVICHDCGTESLKKETERACVESKKYINKIEAWQIIVIIKHLKVSKKQNKI